MKVLLVDDHPLFRDGMATLLASREIEVVGQAREGSEALEKTRELRPDLVLMDINMPGLGGIETTRLLKMEMPHIKVVILTVSDEEQDLFEAIKSGADGYLVKDLESEEFFELLEGVTKGESPITRSLATKILGEYSRVSRAAAQQPKEEALTEREVEVLRLAAAGNSNKSIAAALQISENTVKYHFSHILGKLHLQNRAHATAWAVRHGIVPPDSPL